MSEDVKGSEDDKAPEATYLAIGFAALLATFLALAQRREPGIGNLVPVVIGGLGLLLRWSTAGPTFLGAVAWLLSDVIWFGGRFILSQPKSIQLPELVVCCGTLIYLGALYRLVSLGKRIFPRDSASRHPGGAAWSNVPPASARLDARHVSQLPATELPAFFLTIVSSVAFSLICFFALWQIDGQLGLPAPHWRAIVLSWILGVGLFAIAHGLALLEWTSLSGEEALLYVENDLWHTLRGEYRVLLRWTAWARLRRHRKEQP